MKLPLPCLVFWLRKAFPQAVCTFPDAPGIPAYGKSYGYPVFSDAAADPGHVVIAFPVSSCSFEQLPEDSFLVIPGGPLPDRSGLSSPCMALGAPALSFSEVYNLIMSVFERFNSLHENLRLAVDDALSYQAIIDFMEDVTDGASMFLMDAGLRFIALSGRAAEDVKAYVNENNSLTPYYLFRQMSNQSFQETASLTVPYHFEGIMEGQCRNLFLHHSLIGRAAVRCDRDPVSCAYYSAILNIAASYIEKLCRRTGGFHSHKDSSFDAGYYLSRLLNDEYVSREEIHICLSALGWESASLFNLVLLKKSSTLSKTISTEIIAEQISAGIEEVVCLPWDDGLLFIWTPGQPGDRMVPPPQWLLQLVTTFSLKAGVSRMFSDIHHVRTAFRQAQAAIEMGRIYSPSLRFYLFDDYSYHYLLRNGRDGFSVYDIGDPALFILDEYDRQHETKLSLTLYTFLRLHCSATAAARELYIARGSLLKRITRIQELTGIDFDDFWRYSYLLFSYSLRIAQEKMIGETGTSLRS